jgi:AcrR family transcriptional regulator
MTHSDIEQESSEADEVATGDQPVADRGPDRPDTRQRILDVALDLFTEQGYDGTSLREIADQLGITKAALYYYFESKEDIFLALHMRLHDVGKDALRRMGDQPVTLELWSELLNELIDQILPQRQIFLMHLRNEATLEKLHNPTHDAENEDIQNRLRLVLGDPNIPLGDRVRMAASVGVLFSGFFLSGDAFAESSDQELGTLLREVLRDVLRA